MQKILFTACALGTLAATPILAENQYPFTLGVGYRHDQVHWDATYFSNKELTATGPAGSSKTGVANEKVSDRYNNLNMLQLTAALETVWHHVYFNGSVNYGYIGQGHAAHQMNVKSPNFLMGGDPAPDDLQITHFSQKGESMGDAFDAEVDIGAQIRLGNTKKAHITPFVGYMYDYEKIKQTYDANGGIYQIRFTNPLTLQLDPKKTNRFYWSGPVFGFFLDYSPNRFLTLKGGYSFHWLNFHQHLDETFRVYVTNNAAQIFEQDIEAKAHSNDGIGNRGFFAAYYALTQKWKIGLDLKYQYFNSHHGKIHGHDKAGITGVGAAPHEYTINDKSETRWWSFQSMFEVQHVF